jgi:hypothetical protein
MSNELTLNPCGHTCTSCPSYQGKSENACPGCLEADGNPWWGSCKVYECSTKRGANHCGLCDSFPCEDFVIHYDPENPLGQRNAIIRTGVLAYRARHDDAKAIELVKKLKALEK